jgi:mono/diheme cytochrome c family protein
LRSLFLCSFAPLFLCSSAPPRNIPVTPRIILAWIILLLALVALGACGAGAAPGAPADPVADGQRLFNIWCSGCHTLDPDGPTALGPSLAGVATRAATNPDGLSAADWLRRETINPDVSLTPGYAPGLMPSNYEQTLRPDQIDALIAFMLTLE